MMSDEHSFIYFDISGQRAVPSRGFHCKSVPIIASTRNFHLLDRPDLSFFKEESKRGHFPIDFEKPPADLQLILPMNLIARYHHHYTCIVNTEPYL